MGFEIRLDVTDFLGKKKASVVDFVSLTYNKELRGVGWLDVELRPKSRLANILQDKDRIQVWLRDVRRGIGWRKDFEAVYRDDIRSTPNKEEFFVRCFGLKTILSWRRVGYKAGLTGKSKFSNKTVETIMKELVKANLGTLATTANGRLIDGQVPNLIVEADAQRGVVLNWAAAYRPLLEELFDLSFQNDGDFDLVGLPDGRLFFKFISPTAAVDKSSYIVFSVERGNLVEPSIETRRSDEKTAVFVGGQGRGDARQVAVALGENFEASTAASGGNHIEEFADRRDAEFDEVSSFGLLLTDELKTRIELSFDVNQVGRIYGDPIGGYNVGDIIRVQYKGISERQEVVSATVSFSRSNRNKFNVSIRTAGI